MAVKGSVTVCGRGEPGLLTQVTREIVDGFVAAAAGDLGDGQAR